MKRNDLRIALSFLILSFIFFYGCASAPTKEMAMSEGSSQINLNNGSLCMFSLKTENKFKPEWPPEVYGIELIEMSTNQKVNVAVQSMSTGSLLKKGLSDAFTYNKGTSTWEGLINFNLSPGSYKISAIRGGCTRSIGIGAAMASFDFPFDIPFIVKEKECVYLGRIEMINRERRSEEEIPSGDTTPSRIPQQNSGFGTGTFDVKVFDNFNADMSSFATKYPALKSQKIEKRILSQWTRPANYKNQ